MREYRRKIRENQCLSEHYLQYCQYATYPKYLNNWTL